MAKLKNLYPDKSYQAIRNFPTKTFYRRGERERKKKSFFDIWKTAPRSTIDKTSNSIYKTLKGSFF